MTTFNEPTELILREIAETAGYLWQKGWAERNGGNISVNLGGDIRPDSSKPSLNIESPAVTLSKCYPLLSGKYLYLTGTGERMRDVAKNPLRHGVVIFISPGGQSYQRIAGETVAPTSELPSHLAIHQRFMESGGKYRAILHTHPTELIALTHHPRFREKGALSEILWKMIPETRIFVPKGISVLPYYLTGSEELANETIKALENHDVIMWEKHGALAIGETLTGCFDMLDTLTKSSLIYISAKMAGFEPEGLSDDQLQELTSLIPKYNGNQ